MTTNISNKIFVVTKEEEGERVDLYLSLLLSGDITRSQIQRLIREQVISVNGISVKANYHIKSGDSISIDIPPPVKPSHISPEEIPLDIIFEDKHIVVINKESGMTVHPGAGRPTGTLVNALLFRCKDLSGIGGVERPGIVHRIDKDTSGIIVCAKNDKAHLSLSTQFKERQVKKIYKAIVSGVVKNAKGRIDIPIGRDRKDRKKMSSRTSKGKNAVTEFKVVERYKDTSLLEITILTGRTHQIRVHLAHIGYPVVGDAIYGKKKDKSKHLMLHAEKIGFNHPETLDYMELSAPMPDYFKGEFL